jgi:hypothetical protein
VASDEFQVVAPLEGSKPVSILIVEDEALIASYIEEVLGESGFRVAGIAASGPEALSLAAETRPSLALVDIRLTGPIDGIEIACLFPCRRYFSPGWRTRTPPLVPKRRSRSAFYPSHFCRARCSTRSNAPWT